MRINVFYKLITGLNLIPFLVLITSCGKLSGRYGMRDNIIIKEEDRSKIEELEHLSVEDFLGKVLEALASRYDIKDNPLFFNQEDGNNIIHHAIVENNIKLIEILVKSPALYCTDSALKVLEIKNSDGYTPLGLAVKHSRSEICKLLIEYRNKSGEGIDLNEINYEINTCDYNGTKIVKLLINAGADIDIPEDFLYHSIFERDKKMIKLLINAGVDVNGEDSYDTRTPIYYAVFEQDEETAELLINAGAGVNQQDFLGDMPLHHAASENSKKIAELLINAGADVNAKNNKGRTPLHCAISKNNKAIAELLINKGANVNEKDAKGRTPAHYTLCLKSTEMFKLLVRKGANLDIEDNNGKNPIHYKPELWIHLLEP